MRIAVLVSGGVDSSVALRLLQEQGHELTAFYLKIWLEDELSFMGACPWEEDLGYVRAICAQAGVPLEVLSFQREYWDHVVGYTLAQIRQGRTPNPDIMCNHAVKFGAFLKAIGNRFDKIATGHYARLVEVDGEYHLYSAPDPIKDQTYFLSYLTQEQLSRALFPIGDLSKHEVRAKAHAMNLATKDRKDSQGICFLGKIKFADFLRFHLGVQKGLLVDYETHKVVGEHQGFWYYTIGQRQGIGLSGGPWYVVAKNSAENIVYVSREYYDSSKKRDRCAVSSINWIGRSCQLPALVKVKLRHGSHTNVGQLAMATDGGQHLYTVSLEGRDQGIAPGQFAVFYRDDRCLAGGIIDELLEKKSGQSEGSMII